MTACAFSATASSGIDPLVVTTATFLPNFVATVMLSFAGAKNAYRRSTKVLAWAVMSPQ